MSRPPKRPGPPHRPFRRDRQGGKPPDRDAAQSEARTSIPLKHRQGREDGNGLKPTGPSDRARAEGRADRRPHWLRRSEPEDEDRILIWGIHAVEAVLRNPARQIRRLLLTDNAAHRLSAALVVRPTTPTSVSPRELDRELGSDTVHQGALVETAPLPETSLDDVLASVPRPLLVVLDQVTDPHNVGAILRSAAAFGVSALVMTRRHSPPPSGALAKSASGALELVPLLRVGNLARLLAELGEKGVERLGLDSAAEEALEDVVSAGRPPSGAIALVLGAEEHGLRRLTKESCDRLVYLSTPGALRSLNVSNAAAIAMHHIALAMNRR
ncbi:MAG: RNA methyltransferase [Hyphomicrobiaceae bacterium]